MTHASLCLYVKLNFQSFDFPLKVIQFPSLLAFCKNIKSNLSLRPSLTRCPGLTAQWI